MMPVHVAATRACLRAGFARPPVQEDFELMPGCAMMVPLASRGAVALPAMGRLTATHLSARRRRASTAR